MGCSSEYRHAKPGTETVRIASKKSVAVRSLTLFLPLDSSFYSLRPPLPLRPARHLLPLPPNLPQNPCSPLGLPIESAFSSSFRTVSSSSATGSGAEAADLFAANWVVVQGNPSVFQLDGFGVSRGFTQRGFRKQGIPDMEFGPSDSSGKLSLASLPSDHDRTDDDFPPPLQNRGVRQHMTGNGRTTVGAIPYARVQSDMEIQIHRLEQEAYTSVLRAFKAQSDAITWEKESLITELRKELKVSDEEHRELLNRVNADDIIRRIREWRQEGGHQSGVFSNVQSDVPAPSPTISASRKRQRTQPVPSLSLDVPSTGLHSQPVAVPMQPSPSAAKRTTTTGPKGKKSKTGQAVPGASSMKSMQYSSSGPSGRGHMANKNSSSAPGPVGLAKAALYDPLIGRKVMTRWPDDNNFYEAVIHDYNSVEGLHALVYDVGTEHETWEWVNLKEIPPEDLRWDCDNPGISHRPGLGVAPGVPERGAKKPSGRSRAIPGAGRGRGIMKNQTKKPIQPPQDGIGKNTGDIEILDTKILIKEVEKVFSASQPDPKGMKDAKNLLKTHEQSLIAAIARLADVSDGESEEGKHQYSHGQSMERDRGWRNHMIARAGEQEGYDGNHLGGDDDDDDT
ncbi:hypothetical protein ZIOFF_061853 [Zingiber officinale]|uniref:ENT domain-containing protein n=1 Tax=Zingiber officinale TaxID=94328 RepID=A0A8J5F3B3_ZINOF|nr:hypothetical protein ZIOFF_061853 [Zingiber officinale]